MRLTARMRVAAIFVGVALVLLVAHALVRGSGQVASAPNTRPAGPEQTSTPPPARGSARHQAAPPTPTAPQQPAAPQRAVQTRPIGWEGLMAGPVDVPAWPAGAGCRHEGVRLTEPPSRRGTLPPAGAVVLVATDKGDVDGDGDAETVAIVHCVGAPERGPMQVVAFTRDIAGRIVALGQVTRDERLMLLGVEVQPNGAVQIDAVDGAGRDEWHTYRWTGSTFARVV